MRTNPRDISIDEFSYELPDHRIAGYPKKERDESRLLVLRKEKISEDIFKNIVTHLPENSLVIFNNTRVVEARILFQKPTGATIEVFCLEPDDSHPDITTALSTQGSVVWKCLVGNASSWTKGLVLSKNISPGQSLYAELVARQNDHFLIQFSWQPEKLSFAEVLHEAGLIPLPPYIKRKSETADAERYQTVYAKQEGSVAAPTAGLHFTKNILHEFPKKNIQSDFVTLHVGAGTFKPVKSETMGGHDMHAEFIEIRASLVQNLLANTGRPVTAVGTTSLRTLESIYWIGNKIAANNNCAASDLSIQQWEPYETINQVSPKSALEALLEWMNKNATQTLLTKTGVLIVPSYTFRIVDILVTNFHQPHSTLLLLVAAFVGEKWKSAYTYALENEFRFLSYGDGCLLFRH